MTDLKKSELNENELHVYGVNIKLYARAPSGELLKRAVEAVMGAMLPGVAVEVESVDETFLPQARYVATPEGQFGREPLMVATRNELRAMEAPLGEMALVAEDNNTPYVARHDIPNTAQGLDPARVVASKFGWTWVELRYFQGMMAAAQQQAQRAAQQQQTQVAGLRSVPSPQGRAPRIPR